MSVTLHCGDCLEVMRGMEPNSVDTILTDPPYGIGVAEWDKVVDIDSFNRESRRILRPTGFYAFFGLMPSIANWHSSAIANGFHFCEHVVWLKRNITPTNRLGRTHESIYIYAAGERKTFFETKGPYEDVKLPGVLLDITTMEGIDRYIKDLWQKLDGTSDGIVPLTKRQDAFARLNFQGNRSPRIANYSNAWSFYPPSNGTKDGYYNHPTEKPIDVMIRLVRMLTPTGGMVLDPFMGSGTTGMAAAEEGRDFIGIDISAEYVEIARRRIGAVQPALMEIMA